MLKYFTEITLKFYICISILTFIRMSNLFNQYIAKFSTIHSYNFDLNVKYFLYQNEPKLIYINIYL